MEWIYKHTKYVNLNVLASILSRAHGTSIIVTFCLADNNLIMQLMNGSASNIIQLIKFDANIVAMDERLLN